MVSLPIRPDLIKIIEDIDSKLKTITFRNENEAYNEAKTDKEE